MAGCLVAKSKSEEPQRPGSWFVTVLPRGGRTVVGQIVAAVITFLGTGGAAYLGARAANRNTKVEDARTRETEVWERIRWMVTMALSQNDDEAYVGVYLLEKSLDVHTALDRLAGTDTPAAARAAAIRARLIPPASTPAHPPRSNVSSPTTSAVPRRLRGPTRDK